MPYWYYTWNLPTTTRAPSRSPSSLTQRHSLTTHHISDDHEELFRFRFAFGLDPGSTTVYGWPKKGGVYVLNSCLGIELEFLGFDRLGEVMDLSKEARSESDEEEEVHCNRSKYTKDQENHVRDLYGWFLTPNVAVRQLGATWWKSYYAYLYASLGPGQKSDQVLHVGWPTSGDGVWVLSLVRREAYDSIKPYGIIYNARDMDERCRLIERFGGRFYDDPRKCPYLDLAE